MKFGQNMRLWSYFHNLFKFFDFGHFWPCDVNFSFFPYSLIQKTGQNFRSRKMPENYGKSEFSKNFFFNVFLQP